MNNLPIWAGVLIIVGFVTICTFLMCFSVKRDKKTK
jgi:uncharacterized membrane protein YkvI